MTVGKGVGMVRISPDDETNIDVFVTHLAANQDPYNECNWLTCLWYAKCPGYDNSYYRKRQVKQMMNLVTKSNADIKIVAGDLNTRPKGMKQIHFNFSHFGQNHNARDPAFYLYYIVICNFRITL